MAKKQQVTVDEAVHAAGGKPSSEFVKQLEDATGVTAQREREEQAAEHYERRISVMEREVLPLAKLVPMRNNPRVDLGDVSALVASIERNGFIGALSVRELEDGRFEVWAGNRRLKAAQVVGLEEVPCDVYELSEVQALELNLTEQINRSDLTALEEGEACRRLIELSGYSPQQVADKLGQSVSWVRGRLALCGLAGEVKKGLKDGEVALTVAQALASLPTQKMQVQALDRIQYQRTAEEAVEAIRANFCKPLKGAPWKLVDETLVPEAGACSKCPHNSQNLQMPGLFDAGVKAPPTCSNLPCFEGKAKAAWFRATEKAAKAGAKVLPISEGHKLYAHGQLGYGSRFVEANEVAQDDRQKRTWKQLVDEMDDGKPVLHVAQAKDGTPHELYVKDAALKAVAEELGLKWAKKSVDKAEGASDVEAGKSDWEKQNGERQLRNAVTDEVVLALAKRVAVTGLTLPIVRAMAGDNAHDVTGFLAARGSPDTSEKAAERFLKSAVADELLSFVFWRVIRADNWEGFDPVMVELAEAEGFDLKAMLKARIEGAKAEALKAKAS